MLTGKVEKFLLTRLMRGVTECINKMVKDFEISTHTPHARRDGAVVVYGSEGIISTHTPHARRDRIAKDPLRVSKNFYSHASCEA